jgi:hypothetical protein
VGIAVLVANELYNNPYLFNITITVLDSQRHITTDSQSVSKSWCRAQSGTFDQRSFFFLKVSALLFGGALSDERSGLSFVSLCQYSIQ